MCAALAPAKGHQRGGQTFLPHFLVFGDVQKVQLGGEATGGCHTMSAALTHWELLPKTGIAPVRQPQPQMALPKVRQRRVQTGRCYVGLCFRSDGSRASLGRSLG